MKNSDYYGVYLKFNPKTDKEYIEKIEKVKANGGKVQTFFKKLIREANI